MDAKRMSWIISGIDWSLLSEKEEYFVESVEKYFKDHGDLTEAQENWLEDIFRDKTR